MALSQPATSQAQAYAGTAGKSSHLVVFGKGLVNTAVQWRTQPSTEQLTAVRVAGLSHPIGFFLTRIS